MTLNLAAIFGAETADAIAPAVPVQVDDPFPDMADDPAEQLPGDFETARPIIDGREHFSLWVDDPDGRWPEFIPGWHYDIRQPSRLRGLFAPRHDEDQ